MILLLFHSNLSPDLFLLHTAVTINPILIFSPCFFTALQHLFSLSPLTCHCVLYLPHLQTHWAPPLGGKLTRKWKSGASRKEEILALTLYTVGSHRSCTLLWEAQLWMIVQIITCLCCFFLQAVWNSPRRPIGRPHRRQHVISSDTKHDAEMKAHGS